MTPYLARGSCIAHIKNQFSVSSAPQSCPQAVVCVSTPRMYSQSGYFLISLIFFGKSHKSVLTLPASFASASESAWPRLFSEEVAEADNVIVKVVERVSRGAENSERQ